MIDITLAILTNQKFNIDGRQHQIIGSYDDGTIDIIDDEDVVRNIKRDYLEKLWMEGIA